jgi:hypothetical protein
MKSIRGGKGLGDSLYLQGVVRHMLENGHKQIKVYSNHADVFLPLGDRVVVKPFQRNGADIIAHYVSRKHIEGTSQFEDSCISAGIKVPVEFRIDWRTPTDGPAVELQKHGKPIILVQLPRSPMDRKDGYGKEILPDCRTIQKCIDRLAGRALIVQIGAGQALYKFDGLDVDLANRTSIVELMDLAAVAHGFLGYCSFMIPLAESFRKPALFVWSRKCIQSSDRFLRLLTGDKVLHGDKSKYIMDDCDDETLDAAIEELITRV